MTPVKSKKVPIIWVVGPPGSGRNTHADQICDRFGYEHIKISELVREEASNETERGRIIKETFTTPGKKVADVSSMDCKLEMSYIKENRLVFFLKAIVVDLIKEKMLEQSKDAKGYVLNGFPRSSKQALYFVNEVDNVDAIIYLYGNTDDMVNRVEQDSADLQVQPDTIRKNIINYLKEMKDATQKFGPKLEKVPTIEQRDQRFRVCFCFLDLHRPTGKRMLQQNRIGHHQQSFRSADNN